MLDAFGNDESLLWLQINRAIFQIDDKVPLQDKEELVVVVMFVPVILTLARPPGEQRSRSPGKAFGCTTYRCRL